MIIGDIYDTKSERCKKPAKNSKFKQKGCCIKILSVFVAFFVLLCGVGYYYVFQFVKNIDFMGLSMT